MLDGSEQPAVAAAVTAAVTTTASSEDVQAASQRSILFVSGYKDIGRGRWDKIKHPRDNRDYIDAFVRLASTIQHPLVVSD
jgi:hypothetical protein